MLMTIMFQIKILLKIKIPYIYWKNMSFLKF